jgi:hypothetical protein
MVSGVIIPVQVLFAALWPFIYEIHDWILGIDRLIMVLGHLGQYFVSRVKRSLSVFLARASETVERLFFAPAPLVLVNPEVVPSSSDGKPKKEVVLLGRVLGTLVLAFEDLKDIQDMVREIQTELEEKLPSQTSLVVSLIA